MVGHWPGFCSWTGGGRDNNDGSTLSLCCKQTANLTALMVKASLQQSKLANLPQLSLFWWSHDHDSTGYHGIQETFYFYPEPGTSAKDDLMIGNLDISGFWTLKNTQSAAKTAHNFSPFGNEWMKLHSFFERETKMCGDKYMCFEEMRTRFISWESNTAKSPTCSCIPIAQ